MLTPGTTKSSALVTTVTHGQTDVEVRVVAAPAVGCVMQLVTSAEPLVLLDSFVLSDLAPAPKTRLRTVGKDVEAVAPKPIFATYATGSLTSSPLLLKRPPR